jgi:hypothetical protein
LYFVVASPKPWHFPLIGAFEPLRAKIVPNHVDQIAKALERAKGIEPSYAAWEAAVLPLNYARIL